MEFILGCNYWASNAGADMWRDFDAECIEKDIRLLSENGIKYLRVFPNWRDFQPVTPLVGGSGVLSRYTMHGKPLPDNRYFLDETMLERFSLFLDVCDKYGVKVIVGLITGWMSGGLFVPPALYNENVITSQKALYFEQLFIKGFVERFKNRACVYAWDLGNECNCMATVDNRWQAASWTAMISNAIKAEDKSRPVVSGMHSLSISGKWTIEDQGLYTDILTTHPYPFWCEFTRIDETLSLRTTMHPTAQTKFYSELGNKPCLAEEIGTMGPMICSDERAADFMRINMFSLWANGASGVMWWCANDQTRLESFPYSDQMVERELGMLDGNGNPKPVLKEMKAFSQFLESLDFSLPAAQTDGVCVLTRGQKQWGVAYMTHILARKAGLNLCFADGDKELPDSKLYLLPSVNEVLIMPKSRYDALKKRVYEGADLYISLDNAILSGFEELCGLKVIDSYECHESGRAGVGGSEVEYSRMRNVITEATTAKVVATDSNGRPLVSVNRYGKGKVFFVNAPIESNLIGKHNAFEGNTHLVYKLLFGEHIANYPVALSNEDAVMTYHKTEDGGYVVALNHSGEQKEFSVVLKDGYTIEKLCCGDMGKLPPFNACIFKIVKNK